MMTEAEIHQAWLEIRATFEDKMLNMSQREAFVKSILSGKLANPPEVKFDRDEFCKCGHTKSAHYDDNSKLPCFFKYNCDCWDFLKEN